jgi:hypothetical protein
MPKPLPGIMLALLALTSSPAFAQDCTMPPRALRTHEPWQSNYFAGTHLQYSLNVMFDLDLVAPIEIQRLLLPLYDEGACCGAPPMQVGNRAQVRVYVVPGSRIGREQSPAGWGLASPGSGQPERIGELLVTAFPAASPIDNWQLPGGGSSPFVLPAGQYGICVELIPTSWSGTAAIPGQSNVPLLSPGPLHLLVPGSWNGPSTADAFVTIRNDGVQGQGWHAVTGNGGLLPNVPTGLPGGDVNLAVEYAPQVPGLAGSASQGTGCYTSPRSVHERIPANTAVHDLAGSSWTLDFAAEPSGGRYTITPGGSAYDSSTALANGIDVLAQTPTVSNSWRPWDDALLVVPLPTTVFPLGFPYPGGNCSEVTISSNGTLYLGPVTDPAAAFPALGDWSTLRLRPQLSPFGANLFVEPWSQLRLELPSPNGGARITWHGIAAASSPADFQLELLPNGDVTFAYGPRLANDGIADVVLVGFGAGDGQPLLPALDWSSITSLRTGSGTIPPRLELSARPVFGTTLDAVVRDLGASTLLPVGGFLAVTMAPLPGGVSLAPIGLNGCSAHVDLGQLLLITLLPNTGTGELRWTWSVPALLPSMSLWMQAGTFTPDVHNPLDLLLSNGLCVHLGQ